jgi:hypothetical protein
MDQWTAVTYVFHAVFEDYVGLLVDFGCGVVVALGVRTHQDDVGLKAAAHTAHTHAELRM